MLTRKSDSKFDLLKKGTERIQGKTAFNRNVDAILAVAEAIHSSLGPKGLDKMIVDTLGDVIVTGEGARILEEMQIENPTAKMVVELAKTIKKNYGDGVTSAVLFVGALMAGARELVELNIAPPQIIDGFQKALLNTRRIIDQSQISIDPTDQIKMRQVAISALNSKYTDVAQQHFADLILSTLYDIADFREDHYNVDLDNIQFIKKEGASVEETQFIDGIIIDKEVVNPMMPHLLTDTKIALIDSALEITKTDFSSEIEISNASMIQDFKSQEQAMVKEMIDALHQVGATVVFCQKGIDDHAQSLMVKHGILAVRRVKHSDMKKLARATGANIVTQVKTLSAADLGSAAHVAQKRLGSDNMMFIEGCAGPKAVSILIRGNTEMIVDLVERALTNAIHTVKNVMEHPVIVAGAGSIEVQLRKSLMDYASSVGGKEQLAIKEYANAIEMIPTFLIENAGKDPLDVLTALHSKVDHTQSHYFGFDATSGQIVDTQEMGLYDSAYAKAHVFSMATELVLALIRVDEYLKSAGK